MVRGCNFVFEQVLLQAIIVFPTLGDISVASSLVLGGQVAKWKYTLVVLQFAISVTPPRNGCEWRPYCRQQ